MQDDHTRTMTASEFKAKCLEVFDRLAARELDRVVVTKRGRVVGVVTPPDAPSSKSLFGCMRGTVVIPSGVDLTEPALDDGLDAELGIMHR